MGGLSGLWQTDNYDVGLGLAIGILACLPVLTVIYFGESTRCAPLRAQLGHLRVRLRDRFRFERYETKVTTSLNARHRLARGRADTGGAASTAASWLARV